MTALISLLASPLGKVLLRLVGVLALVGVIAGWGYREGYRACRAAVEEANRAERLRQDEVNERSHQQLEAQLQILRRTNEQLLDQLSQNELEAENDPDADRCGLSSTGVLRHNRLIRD